MEDLPPCLGTKNFTLVAKAALLKAVNFKLVIEGLNNHPGSSVSYLWFLDGNLGADKIHNPACWEERSARNGFGLLSFDDAFFGITEGFVVLSCQTGTSGCMARTRMSCADTTM